MKNCSNIDCQLKNPQSLNLFNKHRWRKDGLQDECKQCIKIKRKENYQKNKEKILSYKKEYRKTNKNQRCIYAKNYYENNKKEIYAKRKNKQKAYRLRKKFGLSLEDKDQMLLKQNGLCYICKISIEKHKKDFAVDHNHVSGKNRGLLCTKCNTGLGLFKDSSMLLREAADYLDLFANPSI